ncbi:MAG: hypothetical protein ACRDQA_10280 [Nocardioidaceae bacterium]
MNVRVDWSRRAEYVHARHGIDSAWANEAVADEHAVWLVPDPASRSGQAVRVIGYSPTAGAVLSVILVRADADPSERPDGDWWGTATPGLPIRAITASMGRRNHEQAR